MAVGHGREPVEQVLGRVAVLRRGERARPGTHARDPVQAQDAVLAVRGPGDVPVVVVDDERVRMERALAPAAVGGGVRQPDREVVPDGGGQGEQDLAVRRGCGHRRGPRHRVQDGGQPSRERGRQHPAQLGPRGLLGGVARACGGQAQQHGQRLVLAEHQRGQAVPPGQAVAAVPAADRLHRHVEVDQVLHVPPDRPLVDAESSGQLTDRAHTTGLEKFEEREHTSGRPGHTADDTGRILSGIAPSVRA